MSVCPSVCLLVCLPVPYTITRVTLNLFQYFFPESNVRSSFITWIDGDISAGFCTFLIGNSIAKKIGELLKCSSSHRNRSRDQDMVKLAETRKITRFFLKSSGSSVAVFVRLFIIAKIISLIVWICERLVNKTLHQILPISAAPVKNLVK